MSIRQVNKTTGDTSRIVAGGTLWADAPLATILAYGGAVAPAGWFLCQGQAISRTTYSELFAIIGTSFGSGDGSTTFNLPDLRESVPKGCGLTGNSNNHYSSTGLALGEFIDDRIQAHTHNTGTMLVSKASASPWYATNSYENEPSAVANLKSGNVQDARYGATTEVKSVGVNYIIKAKQVALPADLESAVEDAVEEVYGDIIPSDASSSNKLVSADTLNGWKGVNKRSPAYKFTRSATKSGCALFADVFGNTFMVSSGDQDVRFSVRQINIVSNNDATKFWRGNGVCYISANTYTLTLIAVFGSLNFEEVSSIISTAPSGTTEFDIATSIPTDTVTSGSTAPITSGGVFQQLRKYQCRNNSITTDINVNGSDGGKTILVMLSSNSGIGDSTSSYIGMIRCGYSGNNFSLTEISKSNGSSSPSDLSTALSVNSNGYIVVAPITNAPNIDAEFICND